MAAAQTVPAISPFRSQPPNTDVLANAPPSGEDWAGFYGSSDDQVGGLNLGMQLIEDAKPTNSVRCELDGDFLTRLNGARDPVTLDGDSVLVGRHLQEGLPGPSLVARIMDGKDELVALLDSLLRRKETRLVVHYLYGQIRSVDLVQKDGPACGYEQRYGQPKESEPRWCAHGAP